MDRRRYFIISELDPEKAIESTMGRVIGEAFYPFSYWAPDGLGVPDDDEDYKRCNTQDIIPNILPKPRISMSRKDFLQSDMQPKIFSTLVRFLNSNLQTDKVHIPLTKFFSSESLTLNTRRVRPGTPRSRSIHSKSRKLSLSD